MARLLPLLLVALAVSHYIAVDAKPMSLVDYLKKDDTQSVGVLGTSGGSTTIIGELLDQITTINDVIEGLETGTVFLPTNEAVEKFAVDKFGSVEEFIEAERVSGAWNTRVLPYSIVAGTALTLADLLALDGQTITSSFTHKKHEDLDSTLDISVKGGVVSIEGKKNAVKVVTSDIAIGQNGKIIIHFVDGILLPPVLHDPRPAKSGNRRMQM